MLWAPVPSDQAGLEGSFPGTRSAAPCICSQLLPLAVRADLAKQPGFQRQPRRDGQLHYHFDHPLKREGLRVLVVMPRRWADAWRWPMQQILS
jgi:hypothetical protein